MMTMVGRRDRHARVLVGRGLHAARHHQADVHAVVHLVGVDAGEEALRPVHRA